MSVSDAAALYIGTYDGYHVLYAKNRLLGWNGDLSNTPTEVQYAYDAKMVAMRRLRAALGLDLDVNYTDVAEKLVNAEA